MLVGGGGVEARGGGWESGGVLFDPGVLDQTLGWWAVMSMSKLVM